MVSKDTWLDDLQNTTKEIEAYKELIAGYIKLSKLPETMPGQYQFEIMKYETALSGCEEFLNEITDYGKVKGWLV